MSYIIIALLYYGESPVICQLKKLQIPATCKFYVAFNNQQITTPQVLN